MTEAAWILTEANETIEEKTETSGNVCSVYRRRVAHFTYRRKSAGEYSWAEHNTITQLSGGQYDTRCTAYSASVDPITTGIEETKTETDQTPWQLAYTYTRGEIEGGE